MRRPLLCSSAIAEGTIIVALISRCTSGSTSSTGLSADVSASRTSSSRTHVPGRRITNLEKEKCSVGSRKRPTMLNIMLPADPLYIHHGKSSSWFSNGHASTAAFCAGWQHTTGLQRGRLQPRYTNSIPAPIIHSAVNDKITIGTAIAASMPSKISVNKALHLERTFLNTITPGCRANACWWSLIRARALPPRRHLARLSPQIQV